MSPRPGSLASRLDEQEEGPTVLVVEDEPDIAAFLGAFFRASGLALVHVDPNRPSEVTDAAKEHHVACVLLDLRLDRLSGLDVLSALRADEVLADLPVIIVSADDRADTRRQVEALDVTAFITKPFNVKELFGLVHDLVRGDHVEADEGGGPRLLRHDELQKRLDDAVDATRQGGGSVGLGLIRVRDRGGREPAFSEVAKSARQLQDILASSTVLGCSGPDEVAILLTVADLDAVAQAAAQLDDNLATSVGVALFPEHAADADELYMAADAALTEATEKGVPLVRAR